MELILPLIHHSNLSPVVVDRWRRFVLNWLFFLFFALLLLRQLCVHLDSAFLGIGVFSGWISCLSLSFFDYLFLQTYFQHWQIL